MEEGWIKIQRKFRNWEWYQDGNTVRVFLHCLLLANHKKKKWRGQLINRGEFLTGRQKFASEIGLTAQQVRTCWNRLKSTNEITIESTNKGTKIRVCNYDTYQSNEENKNPNNNQLFNQRATSNQPAINQQSTTTKNDKNDKNISYVGFVEYWNAVNGCSLRITEKKRDQIKARLKVYSEEELKTAILNRSLDEWINGEGLKYKSNWDSFWRNDEKPEKYLNQQTTNQPIVETF